MLTLRTSLPSATCSPACTATAAPNRSASSSPSFKPSAAPASPSPPSASSIASSAPSAATHPPALSTPPSPSSSPAECFTVDFPTPRLQSEYDLKPIPAAPGRIVYGSEPQAEENARDRKRMKTSPSSSSSS